MGQMFKLLPPAKSLNIILDLLTKYEKFVSVILFEGQYILAVDKT